MLDSLKQLDRILRGDATRLSVLRDGTVPIALGSLSAVIVFLGLIYGFFMGFYGLFRAGEFGLSYQQLLASTVKVPMLFFLTLWVTFPSLYVFNALVGSRLRLQAVLRLLVAALGVTLAVLASLGPIVAFFSVSTDGYRFMVLLNVAVFAIAGSLGLMFLLRTLHRLSIVRQDDSPRPPNPSPAASQPGQPPEIVVEGASRGGALERPDGFALGPRVKAVFACWVVLFGLVGAQMSWVLRPFIGNPHDPFTFFRLRESNFFEAVAYSIFRLFQ